MANWGIQPVYAIAVLGSLSVELAAALKAAAEADGVFPGRYRRMPYLAVRALFAIVCAGSLPIVFDVVNPGAAFYLGASAPVLFSKLAEGIVPPELRNGGGQTLG